MSNPQTTIDSLEITLSHWNDTLYNFELVQGMPSLNDEHLIVDQLTTIGNWMHYLQQLKPFTTEVRVTQRRYLAAFYKTQFCLEKSRQAVLHMIKQCQSSNEKTLEIENKQRNGYIQTIDDVGPKVQLLIDELVITLDNNDDMKDVTLLVDPDPTIIPNVEMQEPNSNRNAGLCVVCCVLMVGIIGLIVHFS
jgi:hypothetical protein